MTTPAPAPRPDPRQGVTRTQGVPVTTQTDEARIAWIRGHASAAADMSDADALAFADEVDAETTAAVRERAETGDDWAAAMLLDAEAEASL